MDFNKEIFLFKYLLTPQEIINLADFTERWYFSVYFIFCGLYKQRLMVFNKSFYHELM